MKKIALLFSVLLLLVGNSGFAQQVTVPQQTDSSSQTSNLNTQFIIIGCLSYDEVLKSMPQYIIVEYEMDTLRQAYEAEMKRVEDDFNQKYEAFLDGRKDYPRTILLKRQTELQQILERNVAFKEQGRKDLEQARKEKLAPLHARLSMAISEVARQHQLAVVVNTDANACPFIDPGMAVDISEEVKLLLSNEKE